MESIYIELALNGAKIEFARIDNIFITISEVCDGKLICIFPLYILLDEIEKNLMCWLCYLFSRPGVATALLNVSSRIILSFLEENFLTVLLSSQYIPKNLLLNLKRQI